VRLIDIGGSLYNGLLGWSGRIPVAIEEMPPRSSGLQTFSFRISMALHSSTYLETAAHLYPERINLDQVPPNRCFLDAVVLHIPLGPNEHIASSGIHSALTEAGEKVQAGEALLINTGWYHRWDSPEYFLDPPHFTPDAIEAVLGMGISLLGCDSSRWDDRSDPQHHLATCFRSDVLMLACLTNLDEVRRARVKLVVLPLKVASCCAPCRAIVLEEAQDWLP